jgi:hypothetical protein
MKKRATRKRAPAKKMSRRHMLIAKRALLRIGGFPKMVAELERKLARTL